MIDHVDSLQDAIAALTRLGCKPTKAGDGYTAFCPIHEAGGSGHKPSLTINAGDKVPVVVNCHAGCDGVEILKVLDITPAPRHNGKRRIVATYSYCDLDGHEVRQKIRYDPKDFRIRHRDAAGNWIYKAGDGPAVLYRLLELRAAIAEGRTVFVVEGEKDADRLASLGLVATCNIEGAAKPDQRAKWRPEYTEQLSGAACVVLVPDNDESGRAHMRHVAEQLRGKVGEVRWLELPGLPEKGDVSDWLDAGGTVDKFLALADEAPEPPAAPKPARAGAKKDRSLHSIPSQSISYSFTLDDLSSISFTAEVPHLHDYDEKGRPTLIESKVANQFAILMKGRFAFCRESLRWYAFAGIHWHAINGTVLDELVTRMLYAGAPEGFKARTVTAVLSLLTKGLLPLPENRDARALPFQNGLLNLDTRELAQITPDNAPIWCLPYAYDPAADCPTFKTWLLQAVDGDTETVEFLRAWLAALLTGRADLQKFLHLLGPGGTGKGVFTRLAELLVGKHNATITDLRNLEQNRFETASLYGKRLVCITDTSKYGGSIDVLKAMTGQDSLRLERKHQQQGATFRFGGLVLLASNEALQTTDYTSALERRRLTVEFKRLVSDAERADWNARGGEEAILHREIAGVANWVLGLSREDVTRRLTRQPRRVAQSNREALRNNNPVADWLIENTIPEPGARVRIGDHRPINEHGRTWFEHADERLYPNYLTWCHRAKREPLALRRFSSLAVDMARSLGVDVLKTREGSGVHLKGLRLRSESETPHDWLKMNEETAETVKDGEGLVKEVKDCNKKSSCNQLIMNEMMDVKDFPNIYSHMDAGTSFFAEPPGKVAATCQPAANYPFRYVTKCNRPTPIPNPTGWGDPIGCSNCGARWGDESPSVAAEIERGGIV